MSSSRFLRILYVAYPMLAVSEASCGGAEQILWTLESEMDRRGHRTTVAACDGSRVAGELFATGAAPHEPDRLEERDAQHAARILDLLARRRFDLVHDHSGSFWRHAARVSAPVLATLHLPRNFYPADTFAGAGFPPNVFFNCVSESQLRAFTGFPQLLGAVPNGIRLGSFPPPAGKRDGYLLWLGRICEEKGAHLAIAVARRAGLPLIIAGDVYPFSYHQAYFEREVRPHLNGSVCYVARPGFDEKVRLLRGARALLVPSLADETSSLVAMEAMACGTPVLAFRRGALPEVVRDGVTGILPGTLDELVAAVRRAGDIDPGACRAHVAANFSAGRMAGGYERLYGRMTRPLDGRANCSTWNNVENSIAQS